MGQHAHSYYEFLAARRPFGQPQKWRACTAEVKATVESGELKRDYIAESALKVKSSKADNTVPRWPPRTPPPESYTRNVRVPKATRKPATPELQKPLGPMNPLELPPRTGLGCAAQEGAAAALTPPGPPRVPIPAPGADCGRLLQPEEVSEGAEGGRQRRPAEGGRATSSRETSVAGKPAWGTLASAVPLSRAASSAFRNTSFN